MFILLGMYNFVPSLSWFGFGSRNQGENHNKQLFELHLWQQQIMQAVDSVPTLTGCCIQGDPARILARYQACHVTHQLGISTLILRPKRFDVEECATRGVY